ncbi:MAG TPA: beta-glucosidase [Micromonosporaceae bacterium]|nr:beta-glucosidase [Micromonosporaceae bacterium]
MDRQKLRTTAFASGATVVALTLSLLPPQIASAASAQAATVSADRAVYMAAEGSRAEIIVTVTTADGLPLTAATKVDYSTTPGTATPGSDYQASPGTLTFAAGSASGSTQRIRLAIHRDWAAETAETLSLGLTPQSAGTTVAPGTRTVVINANGLPYLNSGLSIDRRVSDLLSRMTLEEKIGQMTQAERAAVAADHTLIAQWKLGSILSGGGSTPTPNTPAAWVAMVNDFQAQAMSTRLQIPLIYGIDAVHGHGNVYGATIFPHNVGLGSTRDPRLMEKIGEATAAELRATGIPWNFSPCICVSRDERWGRTYESLSEDPALVAKLETIIDGMQGKRLSDDDSVLATVKHYAGDGDTEFDTAVAEANKGKPWWEQKYTIDQGITVTNRADFARFDLSPYLPAIRRHDVGSVMPSFSSIDWIEDGVGNPTKMHAQRELIDELLKDRLRFDGFVISDWEGIHQIPDPAEPTNGGLTAYKVRVGVNAGTDMFMEPHSAKPFEDLLLAEVNAGRVSQARIDDAVKRILRKKFELGLFENPFASSDNIDKVGSAKHRAIARQAVAQSQVLLKNSDRVLPLDPRGKIYVAGRNADNIGNQAGGWTIQWQGESGDIIPGTTILEGIREVAPSAAVTYSADASAPMTGADVGVVVIGETPYAEGYGDVAGPECGWCTGPQQEEKSLSLQAADKAVIEKVCGAISKCVVLVVSGRPQVLTDQIGQIDALVASWLPGTEGAGVADVLFGRRGFTGRLSMTWPRSEAQVPINVGDANYQPLFPFGWGLRTGHASSTGATMRQLGDNLATLKGDSESVVAQREAIVSAARDAAQAAVVAGQAPADWASLIADADHALLEDDPAKAFALLMRVAG